MARYAIFACDQMFGGLHGMNTTAVIDAEDEQEVMDYVLDSALEVIESYPAIYENLEEEIKETIEDDMTDEDIDELRREIYLNDVETTWALVDESVAKKYSTEKLDTMCYNMTYHDFVKKFCIKE